MTPEEIAQWVIDNRYPKSENDKVSDSEMYYDLINKINQISTTSLNIKKRFTTITSCGQTLKQCNTCGSVHDILDFN